VVGPAIALRQRVCCAAVITRNELLDVPNRELMRLLREGHAIDPTKLDDYEYRGTSLGLPRFVERLTWKTFQKTFHRDPETGVLRGWNVRLEQRGLDADSVPLRRKGEQAPCSTHLRPGAQRSRRSHGRGTQQRWRSGSRRRPLRAEGAHAARLCEQAPAEVRRAGRLRRARGQGSPPERRAGGPRRPRAVRWPARGPSNVLPPRTGWRAPS